ncbi:MAG: hypothetical protein MSIBF_02520 [Candidatus Altiarchaeales archaeon IMC4]|nr:MAG: hypothetical protein MSIBF_02520 [Candidatus Altiarchaeales archaeon IMC4]
MPVIPIDVRYDEKLIGPLSLKQSIYAMLFFGSAACIFLFTNIDYFLKIIMSLVLVILGIGFSMFDLDRQILNYFSFFTSRKETSWISPEARELMGIRDIRADAVFLEGRITGLIRVKPINFGILGKDDQDTVIYGFLEFLNSLSFPIQIIMRSVNLDLTEYLDQMQSRIERRDDKIAMAYFEHFGEYMKAYIETNRINDRFFYIVVPADMKGDERKIIKNLEGRCRSIIDSLAISGIVAQRMTTQQLLNFYASYFTENFEIDESYLSPITIYKRMWHEAPKHPYSEGTSDEPK